MSGSSDLNLPPLRDQLAEAGISADKRFGQHFLLDLNICRKIARLAELSPGDVVIEVGPGPGGLTRALLESGLSVVAIEKDPRFIPILETLGTHAPGRLNIIAGDALRVDESQVLEDLGLGDTAHIVSNLPYNVGTALLLKWMTGPFQPVSMTLMFQKEVARRIVAAEGDEDFGRLSVIAQTLCEARIVMDLPARAFTPPPKVASAVVRLTPLSLRPPDDLLSAIQTLTQAAFGQRRKMLRSSIRTLGGETLCRLAGQDPNARAETLSVAAYADLARAWLASRA